MDKNYAIGLNVLLRHLPISSLLKETHRGLSSMRKIFPMHDFARGCLLEYPQYSFNDCENIYQKLFGMMDSYEQDRQGVFRFFYRVAADALKHDSNGVFCKHDEILPWRETVHLAGQSIFICAFLAYEDVKRGIIRNDFSFSPYAKTDNIRLRNMLGEGIAENHFHLKGSAPTFLMSWVCLMNHIKGRNSQKGKWFNHKSMEHRFFSPPEKDIDITLYKSTLIAAYLRYHLNEWVNGRILNNTDISSSLEFGLPWCHILAKNLQKSINSTHRVYGMRLDYASNNPGIVEGKPYAPISGEHMFLYRMFHRVYGNNRNDTEIERMRHSFFLYLLAYMRLRAELVQSNAVVGFQNFLEYQDRKDIFFEGFPAYEKAFVGMALKSALEYKAMKSLEVRFTPKVSKLGFVKDVCNYRNFAGIVKSKHEDMLKQLARCDEILQGILPKEESPHALFFVPHLIKKQDCTDNTSSIYRTIKSRHYRLRRGEYARQIDNIISLRKSRKDCAKSIYGIDASAHELYASPEVFACLFRKARYESTNAPRADIFDNHPPKLMLSYHVGEDFFDIVSGLRAIEEAIIFLELAHGDRLGHALALGVEPHDFYRLKGDRIFLPRQELLDNLAWFSIALRKYGLFDSALESWLFRNVEEQFIWLYRNHVPFSADNHSMLLKTYVDAWLLRGDNPEIYKNHSPKLDDGGFRHKLWMSKPYDLLQGREYESIREKNIQARELVYNYHFNRGIRKKGREIAELGIHSNYPGAVRALQDEMLKDVARRGIGIETNPSSNYLIGTFRQYHKHPIIRFYNRWINPDSTSVQAFVSINTDDQGVFDTDLENEYALMASALENAKGDNGQYLYNASDILRWLDDIRNMSLEQSFMLTHRNITEGR